MQQEGVDEGMITPVNTIDEGFKPYEEDHHMAGQWVKSYFQKLSMEVKESSNLK